MFLCEVTEHHVCTSEVSNTKLKSGAVGRVVLYYISKLTQVDGASQV